MSWKELYVQYNVCPIAGFLCSVVWEATNLKDGSLPVDPLKQNKQFQMERIPRTSNSIIKLTIGSAECSLFCQSSLYSCWSCYKLSAQLYPLSEDGPLLWDRNTITHWGESATLCITFILFAWGWCVGCVYLLLLCIGGKQHLQACCLML